MAKAETGPQAKEGRTDSVRPPESLPDASPLERMTELARRILGVPKGEAIQPKKRAKRKRH